MDKSTRNYIQRATQAGRTILERAFSEQLEGTFDILLDGTISEQAGSHLSDHQKVVREKLVAAMAHKRSTGLSAQAAVQNYLREAAFTALNRFVALKMLEARDLVQECVSKGEDSSGFKEFTALAPGLVAVDDKGYRLYIETILDEIGQEVKVLFDRRDVASLLWPDRQTLLELIGILNAPELVSVWAEDETIGWIYQYFNDPLERKVMRKASQAPRNSRELAVRNQFFTPRYVVEFLVDNTLGRMWFNAMGGRTTLKDRCQYLLVKPEESPVAKERLRDPRTLKLLDPACGSMHFGLYAFDLFHDIYCEAWEWEQQHRPGSLDVSTQPEAQFFPLCQTYADQDAFLQDIPRLIIEHNIYGVDIDPRAAQIASLALWLRAQRAWHEAEIKAKDRPLIGQGHVVAATAPPAEPELRELFTANLDPKDAQLFEKTLLLLKGLPELGVLLKVEQELPRLIREASGEFGHLFKEEDMVKWHKAETRLRKALTNFAQVSKSTYQGRLFAQDALEGLRLMDLTREKFDVVVMNPPFGALSLSVKNSLAKAYPNSKNDLLSIFVERGIELLHIGGRIGAITSRTCFFLTSFKKWRKNIVLGTTRPEVIADLGLGVMDEAMVEAAAYVLEKQA